MSDREQPPDESPKGQPPGEVQEERAEVPMMGTVMTRTTRFSRELVATMIALASAAFGFVAALAWNSAIQAVFTKFFGVNARISAQFVYAFVVTVIGVVVIVILGRLATRLSAEPVEFKYPGLSRR